jgi:hypothetical protein
MGFNDRSNSYIHFLLLKLTGKDYNATLVENVTLYVFLICAVLSIVLNIRDKTKAARQ